MGRFVALLLTLPLVLVFVLVVALGLLLGHGRTSTPPSSRPYPRPSKTVPQTEATAVWTLKPADLRPDLPGAQFVGSLDGAFDDNYLGEIAGVWLTMTADEQDNQTALHGVDPASGKPKWRRDLDGALCAAEAPGRVVLCASVLQRDQATGLGTRWRLHLIEPSTGADTKTTDIDAWLTAVHWSPGAFVLLEQRSPAPHAVLSAYGDRDLRPRWSQDLSGRPGQVEMFTEDRVINRHEPTRPGLALDRPRLRDVGEGLVALWANQRTAFVEVKTGRFVMMPHCSRLVDDGTRLWCNEVDGASAYGYDGRKLFRFKGPRLAFPTEDVSGADVSQPVFIDDDGAGVRVDQKTGKVGPVYTPPGSGTAFGMKTMPGATQLGSRVFLIGKAGTMLIDPARGKVVWRNPEITSSEVPLAVGDALAFGTISELTLVDSATGKTRSEVRTPGWLTQRVGTRVVCLSPDDVALLRF